MKKLVSLALAAVMMMSVAGCASGNSSATTAAAETTTAAGMTAAATDAATTTEGTASASDATTAGSDSESADSTDFTSGDYSGVTLNFWSMWNSNEPQGQVVAEVAKEFEEKTGATINIEYKGRDLSQVIQTALEAQDEVDLFESSYQNIGKNFKDYVYDLTDMAAAADYDSRSYKAFNDQVIEWAGFLACITEQPQVGGVFYNKDIFEASGITETPETWTEFLEACQKMVDNGYQPLALDSAYLDLAFGSHLERVIGQDAIIDLAENGGWSANAGVVSAADQIIDFVNKGYLADGAPDEYPSSQNKIGLTGKVAMVICADYVVSEVNNNTGTEINWGLFNYPSVEGGVNSMNAYAGANSLAITKYSENSQAAFDFIMSLTSGTNDQKMADAATQIPADPSNTEPSIKAGSIATLEATTTPLIWGMGIDYNADKQTGIVDVIAQLYEGKFTSGEDFAKALDALY